MNKLISIIALAAFSILGLAVATCTVAHAQTTGNVTVTSTSHFWRFQCDAQYDAGGNVTAAPTQAFYTTTLTDALGNVYPGPTQAVSWDAIASGSQRISITLADGTTATTTRAALLQAITAVADQVRTSADATSGGASTGSGSSSSSTTSTSTAAP